MITSVNKRFLLFIILFFFMTHLSPLNARIGDALKTFKTPGQHPTGLTFDGQNFWLSDGMTAKIYCLDPENGKVKKTWPAPGFAPTGLAWDGQLLWCTDAEAGWIYGIDLKTGVAEKILESNSPRPAGIAFDGEFLWLVDNAEKKLLKINRQDGMMHENVPAPSHSANDLTFDGRYLWVTDNGDDKLYRVELTNGRVVTFVPSPGPYPYGIVWAKNQLWCADYQTGEIHQLNLDDSQFIIKSKPKRYQWELVHDFRNFGADIIPELDIYMAVPHDLDNQKILGKIDYEPQPAGLVEDQWGQKFAHFHFRSVKPGTFLKPKMKLQVEMYHTEYVVLPEKVGTLAEIPAEIRQKYLVDGFKYDLHHPLIQQGVKEALGEEKHPYWILKNIFDYICEKIDYKLKPLGGWNPAPTVLKRGTGSCSEYTFIFIAMCRAGGLPARYAGSVVVRSEDKGIDDVWHRWAEVYLPNYGWIPVDVSAGDKPLPADRARTIGTLRNKYLITTKSGGDSEYLDFYYNFNARWKTQGQCKIYTKQYAEFVPLDSE